MKTKKHYFITLYINNYYQTINKKQKKTEKKILRKCGENEKL